MKISKHPWRFAGFVLSFGIFFVIWDKGASGVYFLAAGCAFAYLAFDYMSER
jgi:hypothetical protein